MTNVLRLVLMLGCALLTVGCDGGVPLDQVQKEVPAARSTEALRPNLPQIKSAAFDGASTAWVVTAGEGRLLRTDDGGNSWRGVAAEAVGQFDEIYFLGPNKGWAVNRRNELWRTTDGGLKWALLTDLGKKEVTSVRQLAFLNDSEGWLVETYSVWRTRDGGVTWNRSLPNSNTSPDGKPVQAHFYNRDLGWVCTTAGVVYRTQDGGETWDARPTHDKSTLTNLFFAGKEAGWLGGYQAGQSGGFLYRTNDGGDTWRQMPELEKGTYISSVFFFDQERGWAVGRTLLPGSTGVPLLDLQRKLVRGVVLRTEDGGNSWRTVTPGEPEVFFDKLYFTDAQHGWLFARDSVYRTDDGGGAWRVVLRLPPAGD